MANHENHRDRVKNRFLTEGLDNFAPHNVLELLLFYGIPQKDVNDTAHELISKFGSLAAVFDAPISQLVQITGIKEHTAVLIKMIPQLARYYYTDKNRDVVLDSSAKAVRYLVPRYFGRNEETVVLVCMDSKCRVLGSSLIHEGSINAAEINIRKIVSCAIQFNSVSAIIAHNHPGGVALPSPEDIQTTAKIKEALATVGINLLDHIILADGDGISMADSGNIVK